MLARAPRPQPATTIARSESPKYVAGVRLVQAHFERGKLPQRLEGEPDPAARSKFVNPLENNGEPSGHRRRLGRMVKLVIW
jgi:hypothetical protein